MQTKESGPAAGSSPDEQELIGNPTHGDAAKPADDKMAPAIPRNGNEEMEEISIAGRTKMTVPKDRNNQESEDQTSGADERMEAKTELNSILKRSPSKYLQILPLPGIHFARLLRLCPLCSHCLFQVLLPP